MMISGFKVSPGKVSRRQKGKGLDSCMTRVVEATAWHEQGPELNSQQYFQEKLVPR
jgi:hypothetical protein